MAFDENLAQRILGMFGDQPTVAQKKMFGGLAFMLQGNMACGVIQSDLFVRVRKDAYEAALTRPHVREMDFNGKPMRAWVVVAPQATDSDESLREWVGVGANCALSLPPK